MRTRISFNSTTSRSQITRCFKRERLETYIKMERGRLLQKISTMENRLVLIWSDNESHASPQESPSQVIVTWSPHTSFFMHIHRDFHDAHTASSYRLTEDACKLGCSLAKSESFIAESRSQSNIVITRKMPREYWRPKNQCHSQALSSLQQPAPKISTPYNKTRIHRTLRWEMSPNMVMEPNVRKPPHGRNDAQQE